MRFPLQRPKQTPKPAGSILIYIVLLLTMAAVAIFLIIMVINANVREIKKTENRLRAFYAAEAGVEQVKDWFNRAYFTWLKQQIEAGLVRTVVDIHALHTWTVPGSVTSGGSNVLFDDTIFQGYFRPWLTAPDTGQFINSGGVSSFGHYSGVTEVVIDKRNDESDSHASYLPVIRDEISGEILAEVRYLRIRRPEANPLSPYFRTGIIAEVTALAVMRDNANAGFGAVDPGKQTLVTVECDLKGPWVPEIVTPAALMGRQGVASNGQINVHWGEVWTKGDYRIAKLHGEGGLPDRTEDAWIKVRSGGNVLTKDNVNLFKYCDGMSPGGESPTPLPVGHVNYLQAYSQFLDSQVEAKWKKYQDVIEQHQTFVEWPDYSYEKIKAFFIRQGYPVYKTTADGYLSGPDPANPGQTITQSFDQFFNVVGTLRDPDNINWELMPPLYFIDTVDGTAPKADGSNVVTLKDAGNSPLYYGMFFMAASFQFGGGGSPPDLNAPEKPDRTIGGIIRKCRLAGLMYSYGNIGFSGGGNVYGAIYADKGFTGDGSWELFYDWRMADPLRNMVASRVIPAVWDTYNGLPKGL